MEAVGTDAQVELDPLRGRESVRQLLQCLGEDAEREGLQDTPRRVYEALVEMTSGRQLDPATILSTTFEEACDEMVVLQGIEYVSLCEHHLLPFTGTADVGYLPSDRVVGLSKLARLVDCYSRRLQVQERMTAQIANAISKHLNPRGVGVIVRGVHSCMACRGVKKGNATMVTSAMLGAFQNGPTRAEFLALCR